MREAAVRCLDPHGFHWLRYVEWGDPANPRVLVCVHGLTRNGRDFDHVARSLADAYRVVCPDMPGRGRSDWLRDAADYNYPVYCNDLTVLMARVGAENVDWLGTSMGGILGMMLAAMAGSPVRKLVLNDIGCMIPKAAIERIGRYLGKDPAYDSIEGLEADLRAFSPFGELTDRDWRHLAIHSARQDEHGKWHFRYDPGIARNIHATTPADVDLRAFWHNVHGPVLVIRGEHSDLLLPETLEEMRARPRTEVHVVARCGHSPMLMDDAQVGVIRRFLLS